MKKIVLASLILMLGNSLFSQVTEGESKLRTLEVDTVSGWRTGGIFSLNLAQTSLTNWAAGGQNTIAASGLFSMFSNYKSKNSAWDNSLDIGYGILKQGKEDGWIKTDDKIDLLSKYGQKAGTNWYYAALLNFKTQSRPGYKYPNDTVKISDFMAPAYLLGALGMDYKPNKYFSSFLAPFTSKITFVNDQTLADAGAFGVDKAILDNSGNVITPGSKMRSEFGGYIRFIYSRNDFRAEFLKNVSFTSKIDLFSNYLSNPQNIDVSWENQIAFKVNKFITINVNTHLLYDDDVMISIDDNDDGLEDRKGPRTQFKEILAIGFAYKF
jgi:hypothetical protein